MACGIVQCSVVVCGAGGSVVVWSGRLAVHVRGAKEVIDKCSVGGSMAPGTLAPWHPGTLAPCCELPNEVTLA